MNDPVNPLPKITESCKSKCMIEWDRYKACIPRIEKAKEGDCESWYFDYYKCLDKCRVPQLREHMK